MSRPGTARLMWFGVAFLILVICSYALWDTVRHPAMAAAPAAQPAPRYQLLAWNDLGMHCYNRDFKDLAVLPPYNNLWAQLVLVGDPPQIVTAGVTITFFFADNTYSVGKSNFWDYDQQLFGVNLPPNVGLTGTGLAGVMTLHGNHFVAEGIPLTEFRDSAPTVPYPYQLATVIAYDAQGHEIARTTPVAPVSTEMHCDYCHGDRGRGNEDVATGVVEQNILTTHDRENMDDYPAGHRGALMSRRPVLCAECHASNALGAAGQPGVPSLSRAVHGAHAEELPSTEATCYSCHPGPQTRCLRDVMSTQHGMTCTSCHGSLSQVAHNPNPWLNEPRCDSAGCHDSGFAQNAALYRQSIGHGGLYCEACHDSTHAIAPSREANDAIKFVIWQGHNGPLDTCTACHATAPTRPGPHGIAGPTPSPTPTLGPSPTPRPTITPIPGQPFKTYLPAILRSALP